ncbi:PKD domain-containing protein [Desertivirga arenae]|uniref:PKD domain-containing protein n=1 Tax=Desertivirga arenae TaxID=2810309 RepID=UPI001A96DA95|nr:PKD domain-containing protein [Pedobacter sp. SYSU D00823]
MNRFHILFLVVLSVLLSTCKKDKQEDAKPDPKLKKALSENTKILDEQSKSDLQSSDSTSLVFKSSPAISAIKVGDIIASDTMKNAPYGLLRMVTNKREEGGKIIFTTRPALLTEAIANCDVKVSIPLTTSGNNSGFKQQNKTLEAFKLNFDSDLPGGLNLFLNCDIHPHLDYSLKITDNKLELFEFKVRVDNSLNLRVGKKVGPDNILNDMHIFGELNFGRKIITIGALPLTITPKLIALGRWSGKFTGKVSFGYTGDMKATIGSTYTNQGWQKISELTLNHSALPVENAEAEIEPKLQLGFRFQMGFYELFEKSPMKVKADVFQYARLNVSPMKDPWWSLFRGVEVVVGARSDLFPHFLELKENTIFNQEQLLASAPHLKISSDQVAFVTQPVNFNITLPGLLSNYRVIWNYGDGSSPEMRNTESAVHSFSKPGLYRVLVSLQDDQGSEISKGVFNITIKEYSIELISGNNQIGEKGSRLPIPLAVKVVDNEHKPVKDFDVSWIAGNTNQVQPAISKTNSEGIATTEWTLGFSEGSQIVFAKAVYSGNSLITGSPIAFNATVQKTVIVSHVELTSPKSQIEVDESLQLIGKVVDTDGNNISATHQIEWLSSNPAFATVDKEGRVKGITPGSVILTAKSHGKSKSVSLTVTNRSNPLNNSFWKGSFSCSSWPTGIKPIPAQIILRINGSVVTAEYYQPETGHRTGLKGTINESNTSITWTEPINTSAPYFSTSWVYPITWSVSKNNLGGHISHLPGKGCEDTTYTFTRE